MNVKWFFSVVNIVIFFASFVFFQVKTNFRNAITIPEKSWSRFRDIFAEYVDKMKEDGKSGAGPSSATSDIPPTSTATSSTERDPPK